MKTCLLVIMLTFALVLSVFHLSGAQEWKTLNKAQVSWDAVTQDIDGKPLPATDTIKYEVILADSVNKENIKVLWTGPEVTALITLTAEGKYFLGVRALRYQGEEKIGESEISWSDDPAATNGSPFGVVYFILPKKPTGVTLN